MAGIVLNGITWGHSRGITPLLAASQRYAELHAGVEINWKKRTLQEFADFPIEKLAEHYDLLIIDHPWVGCAAATKAVLPLDKYLSEEYLDNQRLYSTGYSHFSYHFSGHQWALAIDAATPAASYRSDLLEKNGVALPQTWEDVIAMAERGRLALPAIPIDMLMNFYTFCIANGGEPFLNKREIISKEIGIAAINTMKELYCRLDRKMFSYNPIAVAELMSSTNDYWYCPFAYAYSNYSRNGFAKNLLHYADVVSYNGRKLQTTIGGTGLSVSAFSQYKEIAIDFASFVAAGDFQRTMYTEHGGQPGHRSAWLDEHTNSLTNNFFRNVLPIIENGYTRPRYNGYLHFQDQAGLPLQLCIMNDSDPIIALDEMNRIFQESLAHSQLILT